MIAVIHYGLGNIGSMENMLRRLDADYRITSDPAVVARAEKVILPGVGAFDAGMAALDRLGLIEALDDVRGSGRPVLGVCLGMQLLARGSEEGQRKGLAWIDAEVQRFRLPPGSGLKVPHMGWNRLVVRRPHDLVDVADPGRFYFVHSYHLVCDSEADVVAVATHGYDFPAVVANESVTGAQFHPEKSHRFGLELLRRFAQSSP